MELDATETGSRSAPGSGDRRMKRVTCYTYSQQGHYARNCKMKNKVRRREFNLIERAHDTYQIYEEPPSISEDLSSSASSSESDSESD